MIETKVNSQRNGYFDFLRGIAIMMVVAIHTFSVDEIDMQRNFVDMNALVRQLLNCAVPIFIAISGYFLCNKKLDRWKDCKVFWKRQVPKVYVPTMVASFPLLLVFLAEGRNPVVSVILMLVCGYRIYYFIALILQYYALLPIFQRVKLKGVVLWSLISLASIIVVYYMTEIKGFVLPLIIYAGPFPIWCIFFALGCYLRKIRRDYSLFLPIGLAIIGGVVQYWEPLYLNIHFGGGFGIKLSTFVYSFAVVMVLFSSKMEHCYKRIFITKPIERLGAISFAVYLYHLYVIDMLGELHVFSDLLWVVRWGLSLAVSALAIELLKYILPNKIYRYVGL